MIRRPPRSTPFPTRRSSDLRTTRVRVSESGIAPRWRLERARIGPAHRLTVPSKLADQIGGTGRDRKSTRLNSSHSQISYAVFCLKKKKHIYVLYGCASYSDR